MEKLFKKSSLLWLSLLGLFIVSSLIYVFFVYTDPDDTSNQNTTGLEGPVDSGAVDVDRTYEKSEFNEDGFPVSFIYPKKWGQASVNSGVVTFSDIDNVDIRATNSLAEAKVCVQSELIDYRPNPSELDFNERLLREDPPVVMVSSRVVSPQSDPSLPEDFCEQAEDLDEIYVLVDSSQIVRFSYRHDPGRTAQVQEEILSVANSFKIN